MTPASQFRNANKPPPPASPTEPTKDCYFVYFVAGLIAIWGVAALATSKEPHSTTKSAATNKPALTIKEQPLTWSSSTSSGNGFASSPASQTTSSTSTNSASGYTAASFTQSTPAVSRTTSRPSVPTTYLGDRYYDPSYRPAVGEHWENGYIKSNGTYVRGHHQTNADDSFWNNYSSRGNLNPHTGKIGTKTPPKTRR